MPERNAFTDFINNIDRTEVDRILRRQVRDGITLDDPSGTVPADELERMKDAVPAHLIPGATPMADEVTVMNAGEQGGWEGLEALLKPAAISGWSIGKDGKKHPIGKGWEPPYDWMLNHLVVDLSQPGFTQMKVVAVKGDNIVCEFLIDNGCIVRTVEIPARHVRIRIEKEETIPDVCHGCGERLAGVSKLSDVLTRNGSKWLHLNESGWHDAETGVHVEVGCDTPPVVACDPAFAVGDVVRLKSGGPAMTVSEVNNTVEAQWLEGGGRLHTVQFKPAVLVKVDEKAEKLSATIKQAVELGCGEGLMREFLGLPTPAAPLYSDAGCNRDGPRFNVGDIVNDADCAQPGLDMEIIGFAPHIASMVECSWDTDQGRTTGSVPIKGLRHAPQCTADHHEYAFRMVTCRCGQKTRTPMW